MGRNNDTFTLIINDNKQAWGKFRRGLRIEDQQLFDEMWHAPKLHLAAGASLANALPIETIFMAMLLDQYKKIKQLEAHVQMRTIASTIIMEDAVAVASDMNVIRNEKLLL